MAGRSMSAAKLGLVRGRYAAARDPEDLVEEFEIDRIAPGEPVPPSWNVAPTDLVPVVMQRGERLLRAVHWGLVPSWSRDPSGAGRLINARLETVDEKP